MIRVETRYFVLTTLVLSACQLSVLPEEGSENSDSFDGFVAYGINTGNVTHRGYQFEFEIESDDTIQLHPSDSIEVNVTDRVRNDDHGWHIYGGKFITVDHPKKDPEGPQRMNLSVERLAGGPAACVLYDTAEQQRRKIANQETPPKRYDYFSSMVIDGESGTHGMIDGFRLRKHAYGGYRIRELVPFPVTSDTEFNIFCFPLYDHVEERMRIANRDPEDPRFNDRLILRYSREI